MRTAVLIDDDQDDLDILQEVLESIMEVACFKFSYPIDALHFLSTQVNPVDFIFVDYNMPNLNGEEVLIRIRTKEDYRNSIVTILSTSIDKAAIERLKSRGANYAFEKSVKFQEFTSNISNVLQGGVRSIP